MTEGLKYKTLKEGGHVKIVKQKDKDNKDVVMMEQNIYDTSTGEIQQVHKTKVELSVIDDQIKSAQDELNALNELKADFTAEDAKEI